MKQILWKIRNRRRFLAYIYCKKEEKAGTKMKRVFGFALFFVALGMVIMMFIPSIFIGILIVLLCLLVGYQLFCC
ncbi:MAG: hypothetical protein EGR13_08750 [Coprococcus comes]|nr:hypothetical protein [Coprococcus comes]